MVELDGGQRFLLELEELGHFLELEDCRDDDLGHLVELEELGHLVELEDDVEVDELGH